MQTKYAMLLSLTLLVIASISFMIGKSETDREQLKLPEVAVAETVAPDVPLPPLAAALRDEMIQSLRATEWPELDPTIDAVIQGQETSSDLMQCGGTGFPTDACTWGSSAATTTIVLVGDSVAMTYAGPLRAIAEASDGRLKLHTEAMFGCEFADDLIDNKDQGLLSACPGRNQHAIDVISATSPQLVIVANSYVMKTVDDQAISPGDWAQSLRRSVDEFPAGTKVVFLSAPPADVDIAECYGKRSSKPSNCISNITSTWLAYAHAEQDLAKSIGATWVDSRPWFCVNNRSCPSFVGTTPTKMDTVHMTPAYGQRVAPVIEESLTGVGAI